MFLELLENEKQQEFFMNFACLVALANGEVVEDDLLELTRNPKSPSTPAVVMKLKKSRADNILGFLKETSNAFPMRLSELLMLRKLANEIKMK
jgi:hypothetical protein